MKKFAIYYYDKNGTSTENQVCTVFANHWLEAGVKFKYALRNSEIINIFEY